MPTERLTLTLPFIILSIVFIYQPLADMRHVSILVSTLRRFFQGKDNIFLIASATQSAGQIDVGQAGDLSCSRH